MEARPVRVSASPTKATTLSCSTIFCTAARCRAGSPPSSAKTTDTGWPLMPPWALTHFTHTRTASRIGSKGAPSTPEATPTLPTLIVAPEDGAGVAEPPGAGAGRFGAAFVPLALPPPVVEAGLPLRAGVADASAGAGAAAGAAADAAAAAVGVAPGAVPPLPAGAAVPASGAGPPIPALPARGSLEPAAVGAGEASPTAR